LRRPTDGQLQALAGEQVMFGAEQHTIAAHVYRLPETDLIGVLPVEDLVANLSLDREAILCPSIVSVSF
jgi:hypothetical protein